MNRLTKFRFRKELREAERLLMEQVWSRPNFMRLFGNNLEFQIKNKKVLILGANRGYEAKMFLDHGAISVVGLELDNHLIDPLDLPFFELKRYQGGEFPFQTDSFDIVYSQAVGEHVEDLKSFFEESFRVCRPGGLVVCISAPLWNSRYGHHKANLLDKWPWIHVKQSPEQIMTQLKMSGVSPQTLDDLKKHIEYMMTPGVMNQLPSAAYLEAVTAINDVEILINSFDIEDVNLATIPREVLTRLNQDFEIDELFRSAHIFKGIKRNRKDV